MLWVLLLHSNKGTGSQVSHMRSVPALRSWVLNTCSHPQNGFRVLHATFRFPCLGSKNLSLSWVPGLRSQVPPRVSGLEFYFLKMLNNGAFRKNYLRKNVGFLRKATLKSSINIILHYNFELLCCKDLHAVYIVKKEEGNEYKPETFKIVFTTGVNWN